MVVFAAGMLATRLAPRFGLDRSIQRRPAGGGNRQHRASSLVSLFSPTFLPFLGGMCVFLLGMGIVNPLGTAQALSPFGEKAGAASALLGFWQMMGAAIGGVAGGDDLASGDVRARHRADGGLAGRARALRDAGQESNPPDSARSCRPTGSLDAMSGSSV